MIFFNKNKKIWNKAKSIVRHYKLLESSKNNKNLFQIYHKLAKFNNCLEDVVKLVVKRNPL